MSTLSTLFASRTSRLVERPLAATVREDRIHPPTQVVPGGQRQIAKGRFLTALLRSLSALSV
jgi:hypothetical protein